MAKLVKRHRHIRLLGKIDGKHKVHLQPKDMVADSMYAKLVKLGFDESYIAILMLAAKQAMNGNPGTLCKLLNSREQDRLFSFLNNNK